MNVLDPHSLEPFWDTWYIDRLIGEGSFGTVYKVYREEFGQRSYSALKIISIPKTEEEEKQLYYDGMDEKSATQYFQDIVEDVYKEITIMGELKGKTNIVSYEDHKIIKKENSAGFYILIRMELLESLNDYLLNNKLTNELIINISRDMCKALILCRKRNLIHRDIKPANIFVSADGDFKLGDFGISRHLEGMQEGLSVKGTYIYMAPEVFKGSQYDERVDIYSLGMMLYYFLNNKKGPFENSVSTPKYYERQEGLRRRFSGEKLPKPANADDDLAQVVLKACEYNPEDRYSSADEFLKALEALRMPLNSTPLFNGTASKEADETVIIRADMHINKAVEAVPVVIPESPVIEKKTPKTKLIISLAGALLIVLLGCVLMFILLPKGNKNNDDNQGKSVTAVSDIPSVTSPLKVTEEPDGQKVTAAASPEPTVPAVNPEVTAPTVKIDKSDTNLKSLDNVPNIEEATNLDASLNEIADIEVLRNSIWLKSLNLESNQISDLSPVSSLVNLTFLNVRNNKISDLGPLSSCLSCEGLILSDNQIDNIDALKDLVFLSNLQLDGNSSLSDISILRNLQSLKRLILTGTAVSDIESIANLKGLTCLDLSETKIKDITPLYGLRNLTEIYLLNTDVPSDQIKKLKKLMPDTDIYY